MKSIFNPLASVIIALSVSGCGRVTPDFEITQGGPNDLSPFVQAVTSHIACEVQDAVSYVTREDSRLRDELRKWSAELTLTLTVDEKSSLSPGVTYTAPHIFSLSGGVTTSSDATRYLEMTWYLFFDKFTDSPQNQECIPKGVASIEGDLRIKQSLFAALYATSVHGNADATDKFGQIKVVKHHVTFEVTVGASATPTWKFVHVTANPDGPFAEVTRKRTDDLLITMGRSDQSRAKGDRVARTVSNAVSQSHFAGQISNSLRSAIRQ